MFWCWVRMAKANSVEELLRPLPLCSVTLRKRFPSQGPVSPRMRLYLDLCVPSSFLSPLACERHLGLVEGEET